MIVEFVNGSLPWRKIKDKEAVGAMKEKYDHTLLLKHMPQDFRLFLHHLQQLNYFTTPDYDFIASIFEKNIKRRNIQSTDPYDWEVIRQSAPSQTTTSSSATRDTLAQAGGRDKSADTKLKPTGSDLPTSENNNGNVHKTSGLGRDSTPYSAGYFSENQDAPQNQPHQGYHQGSNAQQNAISYSPTTRLETNGACERVNTPLDGEILSGPHSRDEPKRPPREHRTSDPSGKPIIVRRNNSSARGSSVGRSSAVHKRSAVCDISVTQFAMADDILTGRAAGQLITLASKWGASFDDESDQEEELEKVQQPGEPEQLGEDENKSSRERASHSTSRRQRDTTSPPPFAPTPPPPPLPPVPPFSASGAKTEPISIFPTTLPLPILSKRKNGRNGSSRIVCRCWRSNSLPSVHLDDDCGEPLSPPSMAPPPPPSVYHCTTQHILV